MVKDNEDVLCS